MDKKLNKNYDCPYMIDIIIPNKQKPDISLSLKEQVSELTKEARTTIVHCYTSPGMMRIWPSTYLVDRESNKKYNLISAINISLYPTWGYLPKGEECFTLIFEGLDNNCKLFRLIEEIPEPGEFSYGLIYRNRSDVYRIEL